MASRTPKLHTIQHFTHIHPLTEFDGVDDFVCDGCKTYGSGKTYRCEPCNYDLHEHCATCPLTLPIFIHPQHALSLVVRKQQSTRQNERACDICSETIEGLFYRCKICEFDVHPLCTKLPQHVRHVLHPAHQLEFSLAGASPCMVCHGQCQSWRYRCELCRFDIHMDCILTVCNTSPTDKTEESDFKSRGLKPQGGQPPAPVQWQQPSAPMQWQQPSAPVQWQQPSAPVQWQQPYFANPYAYGPMGQHPYFGYPHAYGPPMGQQPSFNHHHLHNYNNFNYNMNGFNMNPNHGQVPAAEASQKPGRSKGWRMFTIASRVTMLAVSAALFGVPLAC